MLLLALSRLGRHDFDRKDFLHIVIAGDHLVDGVESCGVVIPFTALGANLSLGILDNVQFAFKPVLLPDQLGDRFGITEFTFHVPILSHTK